MNQHEILKIFSEPLFWLCSTIFSLILGIIGNLLTPYVANYLDQKLAGRKETRRRKQLRLLGQVIVIYDKPQEILSMKLDSLHGFTVSILLFLLGLFAILSSFVIQVYSTQSFFSAFSIILSLVGFSLFSLGLYAASHGFDRIRTIRVAELRKRTAFSHAWNAKIEFESKEMLVFYDKWDKENIGVTMQEVVDDIEARKAKSLTSTSKV